MYHNPGTLDATGDVATESKQDDILASVNKATDRLGGPFFAAFSNVTFGDDFTKANAGFSGTPEIVHDGTDKTGWTGTNLTGSNFTFNSTTHAKQGVVTVIIFGNLSGATITIQGTNITNSVLTEGVEWTAATSNTATATSIASAISAVAGVSATSSGVVVTVIADNGGVVKADITTLSTNAAGTDMTATAQSVDGASAVNGDEALFTAPSSIDFTNFTTLTLETYITDWSTQGGTKQIELRFRLAGVNVGNSVPLSTFVNIGTFDEWQSSAIAKTAFGINTETVDELVIKVIDEGAGTPPSVFFDLMQVEEAGTPVPYDFTIPAGFNLIPNIITFVVTANANGVTSRDNLSLNTWFNEPALAVGLGSTSTVDGSTSFERVLKTRRDAFHLPSLAKFTEISTDVGQTKVDMVSETRIPEALVLKSATGDTITQIVNDNFTVFDFFKMSVSGTLVPE